MYLNHAETCASVAPNVVITDLELISHVLAVYYCL